MTQHVIRLALAALALSGVFAQSASAQYIATGVYHRPYTAWGNVAGYGYGGGYYGGTVAGSAAAGMGQYIQSQGAYNQMTAEANKTNQEAYSIALDNKLKSAQTWDQLREINKQYVAEKQAREAKAFDYNAPPPKRPKLTPSQLDPVTGEIRWHPILMQPMFQSYRDQLQALFTLRAHDPSQVSSAQVMALTGPMRDQLDTLHDTLPTNDFFAARHFIEGLGEAARYTGFESSPQASSSPPAPQPPRS
jgi:hypothetical protein